MSYTGFVWFFCVIAHRIMMDSKQLATSWLSRHSVRILTENKKRVGLGLLISADGVLKSLLGPRSGDTRPFTSLGLLQGGYYFLVSAAHVIASLRDNTWPEGRYVFSLEWDSATRVNNRLIDGSEIITVRHPWDERVSSIELKHDIAVLVLRQETVLEGKYMQIPSAFDIPPGLDEFASITHGEFFRRDSPLYLPHAPVCEGEMLFVHRGPQRPSRVDREAHLNSGRLPSARWRAQGLNRKKRPGLRDSLRTGP